MIFGPHECPKNLILALKEFIFEAHISRTYSSEWGMDNVMIGPVLMKTIHWIITFDEVDDD